VVKHQSNELYAGNALFEISKLRLKDKDFYEAYFNLKRAVDSNFSSKRLQLYKDFTEGVLYIIKRKIKKGVQILSDLLEVLVNSKEKKSSFAYLEHQAYIYRSYGYVAIEKYEMAQDDIRKAKAIHKIDAATIYNKLLGKGILRMDNEDYLLATKFFSKASDKFPSNKDPYCLSIISIVKSYSYSMSGLYIDIPEKRDKGNSRFPFNSNV
jgi:tetratricopeptide (TPR) repeat protein